MAIRIEDQGITLRLFLTEAEALSSPDAKAAFSYGGGWLARSSDGRLQDSDGTLPPAWAPQRALFNVCEN